MEMEAADAGPASNGPCSPTEEHARMLVDLSVTVPARQHDSPDEPMIKQEEGTEEAGEKNGLEEAGQNEEEASGLEEPMTDGPNNVPDGESRTVGSCDTGTRLPNAGDERPFHCSQCGVSFTQKGNLLRHVKLHSGEKPFKCPFCSYACRRRDALTGHLRTHSVGKPHKCNLCGRSYKQRASLEEHKERCHSYMQRVNANSAPNSGQYQEEPLKEQQPLMDAVSIAPFDRPPVIERLQANVGKRKSTTPQKFVGEKLMRYGYPEQPYDMALKYEKEVDLLQAQIMDPTISSGVSYLGSDAMRPLLHHPALTLINPLFPQNYSLGPRDAPLPPPPPPELPPTSNGPLSLVRPKNHPARHGESPGNSRPGSAGSERASPPGRAGQRPGHAPWPGASPPRRQREAAEAEDQKLTRECLRVFSREGRQLRTFRCHHCHLLYLDHVMYTIHMGCHGYRDPFECNICGHRSQDRYEFSSHIVRGEHTFQ